MSIDQAVRLKPERVQAELLKLGRALRVPTSLEQCVIREAIDAEVRKVRAQSLGFATVAEQEKYERTMLFTCRIEGQSLLDLARELDTRSSVRRVVDWVSSWWGYRRYWLEDLDFWWVVRGRPKVRSFLSRWRAVR
ncbi:MAG: hypothetical protein AAGD38_15290 [Acidobacteriota bacterium]